MNANQQSTQIDVWKNCLNTIRLLAAIQVLWKHTLMHLELPNIPVLGDFVLFFQGVPVFFTLSGFLIWQSIGRSHTFSDYAKKRFWRIYPELWLAVVVELVVLLLLYHQPIDWAQFGLFAIGQATFFQFWTPDCLRGYGCGCPNGALWTISVLIQFYFLAFFIYKWLKKKKSGVWTAVILLTLVLGWLTPFIVKSLPFYIGKLYSVSLIPHLWMFLIPAFTAEYKGKMLPFLKKYWWVSLVLLLFNKYLIHYDIRIPSYPLVNTLLLFCGLIGFAYSFPQLNIRTDISYGVYIYHMTIVNAFIALGYKGQMWTLWIVIIITCILAWISTITVGRMSQNMKQKLLY